MVSHDDRGGIFKVTSYKAECFLKWAKLGLYLFISFFSHDKYSSNLTINDKSIDGVLGTRTRGSNMVGADESTELWRHKAECYLHTYCKKKVRVGKLRIKAKQSITHDIILKILLDLIITLRLGSLYTMDSFAPI